VFLGAHQSKISVAFATAMQSLGADVEYVCLSSRGANALDFHIAYYIGLLSAQNSSASFHIVSKDTGFDPLIKHLHSKGVEARRSASVPNVSSLKPARPSTTDARIDTVVAHLKKPKATKPGSKKSLFNLLRALYKKEGLTEDQLSALFASLCERGIVKLDGSKITYDLPDGH
jgi:hypothetical protein